MRIFIIIIIDNIKIKSRTDKYILFYNPFMYQTEEILVFWLMSSILTYFNASLGIWKPYFWSKPQAATGELRTSMQASLSSLLG